MEPNDPCGGSSEAKSVRSARSGRPVLVAEGAGAAFLTAFPVAALGRADLTEVVLTGLNAKATKLVVESWTPHGGIRRVERD